MSESISFVFPMYNEKDNIEEMIFRTLAVAPELTDDFEIVVVDDASTDGCGEIVEHIARRTRRCAACTTR